MTIRVSVVNVGEVGILNDPAPHALPPNAWTAGQNVRFDDMVVRPAGRDMYALGALQIPAYWNHYMVSHWAYVGEKSANEMGVWVVDSGQTHTELTAGVGVVPGWSPAQVKITGGLVNGQLVVNNTSDSPAYWIGTSPVTDKLLWLPWDATDSWKTKNWTTRALRPHKRWLFALGVTEDTDNYPKRIRNSAAAPPGAIPATWDDTDTTNDAAFIDDAAADRYDFIDGLSMGDEFVACTSQTTWIGQATGIADAPFRFRKAFDLAGVLSTDCMATHGRVQYLLTPEDLVVHDGSRLRSVLDQKSKRWLFNNINANAVDAAFIFVSRVTNELWVCFPESGESHCTKALTVNLPDSEKIGMGSDFVVPAPVTYEEADFTYGASNFAYTQTSLSVDREDRLGVSPVDQAGMVCMKHYADDAGPTTTPTAMVERTYLTFPGEARTQLQDSRILRCTAVYPTFDRAPDGDLKVYVGTSKSANGNVAWSQPKTYNAHATKDGRVPFRQDGRYLSIRFETVDGADWALSGYDLDIVPLGYRA